MGSLTNLHDTLTSIQRSIDRHINNKLNKPFSIIRDIEFAKSRESVKAARKSLKKEGKGGKPNASESLTDNEIETMWERKALHVSDHTPLNI